MTDENSSTGQIWDKINKGLVQIYDHTSKVPTLRYMELYTDVFNFCTLQNQDDMVQDHSNRGNTQLVNKSAAGAEFIGVELYNHLNKFIAAHVRERVKELEGLHGEDLLEKYATLWTRFQFSSTVVNGIFSYLNRHWVNREIEEGNSNVCEIYSAAVLVWNQILFSKVHSNITSALLCLIQKERDGEKITTSLLSCVISSYLELGCNEERKPSALGNRIDDGLAKQWVYKQNFEALFLEETREYYANESTEFVQTHTVTDYLKKVEQRLKEESDRCVLYLTPSTNDPLMKTCHDVLIQQHLPIFQTEFEQLLLKERDQELGLIYSLCEHVDGAFEKLYDILQDHIESKGRAAIERVANTAITDPKQYVNVILEVHRRYNDLVNNAFHANSGFVQAMDKALASVINQNRVTELAKSSSKSPELLARCCDLFLRKSSKNSEDLELESLLSQVIVVFKYIQDKDVFQKFYSKMLAKRLVSELSASDEGESIMIAKLKQMCGFEYTSKLQRMFTDASLSKEMTDEFKQKPESKNCIDSSVMILTTGVWPMNASTKFEVTPELKTAMEKFAAFYQTRHTGRRLSYALNNCRGEVTVNCFEKQYTFVTTAAQISILTLFNDVTECTFKKLCETLKMDPKIALDALHQIVSAEVLNVTHGSLISEDATLALNEQFQSKKRKVDLTRVSGKLDALKETQKIHSEVEEDRKYEIEAASVRIMKTRKKLKHALLISEVISQMNTRFRPNVPVIKKAIDSLIEREFLERDEHDFETLKYVA